MTAVYVSPSLEAVRLGGLALMGGMTLFGGAVEACCRARCTACARCCRRSWPAW